MSTALTKEAQIAAAGGSIHEYRKATRKMRWWYEALADYMVANPSATQNEMAAHFGRATGTISTIIHTDAFRAYYRQRRAQIEGDLSSSVRDKMLKVADRGLGLILDQFEKKRDSIPIDTLQRTVDSTLKSLGYGAQTPTGVNVNINGNGPTQVLTVPVALSDLEEARAALRRSQEMNASESPPTVIDVTPND